jgi:hypothetical protein
MRAPAVPLIAHDPSFNLWSTHDRLAGGWTSHWTGAGRGLAGMVRVDGVAFNLIGKPLPDGPELTQTGCTVWPTRTCFTFAGAGIALELEFCSPLLPDDLEVLARPVSYLTWTVRATDGRSHAVNLYVDITGEWAVDQPNQPVTWSRFGVAGMEPMAFGAANQQVLGRAGDNLRADWGYVYLGAPVQAAVVSTVMASTGETRPGFAATGTLPAADDLDLPRAPNAGWPGLCAVLDLGTVAVTPVSAHALLAYDDIATLSYLGRRCVAWWRRDGRTVADLLATAAADHGRLTAACAAFDQRLMAELTVAGGTEYAELCALAYRQCLSAHGLAADTSRDDTEPMLLHFSKENFSNGCVATVDVTYPGAPFFLAFAPQLLQGQLEPVLRYARSRRWKHAFAPHDLGTYPLADGQVYGGGERSERDQMPVEECGNMLILVAAYSRFSGDFALSREFLPLLERWADYLLAKGLDPEHQLCTDDFAGHLAHNTNLALKAIIALGAQAWLVGVLGDAPRSAALRQAAEQMAAQWQVMADDGDHYRLTFDRPGTWSQKYNLVWDQLLGLDLFPPEVARREIAFYLTQQERFGLPLDSRCAYTKNDWLIWSATMAERPEDFAALIAPVRRWVDETPTRVPLTDWYWTTDGRQAGFQARSVVGGFFIKLLAVRLAASAKR